MEMSNMPNGSFQQAPPIQNSAGANAEQQQPVAPAPAPETPSKRRPGRPKGSTKKNIIGEPPVPKVKRPVGRPRKDGFPAGSVGPSRPRAKQPTATTWTGVGYPQPYQLPSISAAGNTIPIDPNLQSDDWALLCRTNPNAFLTSLLSSLAAPNPVSTAGPTVEEAFKSHLNSLTPMSNQHQPIPSLYSILKTFWLPSSPAYFSLTASASTARTPSEHRFLYWDPQPLIFNGISCPSCATPLANRGRISSGPIKIYDIEKPFFIIGCEYICRSAACLAALPDGRKFASTDASIFRALPAKLKDEFPARLLYADADAGSGAAIWNWGALGVSLSLWNLVRGCLRAGMRKEGILQLVEAVQRGVPEDDPVQRLGAGAMGGGGNGKMHQGGDADGQQGGPGTSEGGGGAGAAGATGSGGTQGEGEINHAFVQTFIDAYNDAWKANSGAGAGGSSASTSASGSSAPQSVDTPRMQSATPQPQPTQLKSPPGPNPPTTQVFDYTKSFTSYPFAGYPFFPPSATPPVPVPVTAPSPSDTPQPSTSVSAPTHHTPTPGPESTPAAPSATASTTAAPAPLPLPPLSSLVPPPTSTPTPGPGSSSSSTPAPSLKRPYPFTSSTPAPTSTGTANLNLTLGVGSTTGVLDTSKRSPRHCCKCGSQDCKGKGGRSFCVSGCQDCGKLECRGRNSRRPDKRCSEGWA
ncbi:hypothetical protein C0995_005978 [Termitomyces sp. Mi166|nr:hypothetical protein C0995_005978 [Termitomyces sp. Mi166\